MDFPIFHLDFMGNRILIAIIAILHVVINHSLAVGLIPYVTYMEYVGYKNNSVEWDELARKVMFFAFLITTSLGAMTGVGIWLSASLVSPASIGSLIRVFFLAWFVEWIVFVTEVVLILIYFLSWKRSNASPEKKWKHIKFGAALSAASWVTMAIIVAILGFMMDPGNWRTDHSLFSGVLNPVYPAQLAFRTPLAMVMGGCITLALIPFFVRGNDTLRRAAVRLTGIWILAWTPFLIVGSLYYYHVIPDMMRQNMSVAIGTMEFSGWYDSLMLVAAGAGALIGFVALLGVMGRWRLPALALVLPFFLAAALLVTFERAREFIRKPYVIADYMYSNMVRPQEMALLNRDGILKHATYVKHRAINPQNRVEAGKDVFMLACSRCHTSGGINSVVSKFQNLLGPNAGSLDVMVGYMRNMHKSRYFMPPFPGNEAELEALAAYILSTAKYPDPAEGAQEIGVSLPKEGVAQ
ncbi:MAG: cytochrome c [Turneriella sp.]